MPTTYREGQPPVYHDDADPPTPVTAKTEQARAQRQAAARGPAAQPKVAATKAVKTAKAQSTRKAKKK